MLEKGGKESKTKRKVYLAVSLASGTNDRTIKSDPD